MQVGVSSVFVLGCSGKLSSQLSLSRLMLTVLTYPTYIPVQCCAGVQLERPAAPIIPNGNQGGGS